MIKQPAWEDYKKIEQPAREDYKKVLQEESDAKQDDQGRSRDIR